MIRWITINSLSLRGIYFLVAQWTRVGQAQIRKNRSTRFCHLNCGHVPLGFTLDAFYSTIVVSKQALSEFGLHAMIWSNLYLPWLGKFKCVSHWLESIVIVRTAAHSLNAVPQTINDAHWKWFGFGCLRMQTFSLSLCHHIPMEHYNHKSMTTTRIQTIWTFNRDEIWIDFNGFITPIIRWFPTLSI